MHSPCQVDKALRLAAHGLEVGHLDGKRPLTRHGFKDFTTDAYEKCGALLFHVQEG